MSWVCTICRLW